MRGFTREVLSLVAWGAAAVGGLFALIHVPELVDFASEYLQPEIVAKIAVGGGVFLVVLIIVSLISVKLSDVVVDSAAGAFDRTLGFYLRPGARTACWSSSPICSMAGSFRSSGKRSG